MKDQLLYEVRWLPPLLGPNSKTVLEELADMIHSIFAGTKIVQRGIGVPITLGRVWLDIITPHGPPPEYERSGYARPPVGIKHEIDRELTHD